MSKFTGEISIKFLGDGQLAQLEDPIIWHAGHLGSGRIVEVPAGFVSDGFSVPQALWWFIPPWGSKFTRAAILHDYLCEQIDRNKPVAGIEKRRQADYEFYLALKALGMNPLKAYIAYLGVSAYSTYVLAQRGLRRSN